jgi:hypothetical protein
MIVPAVLDAAGRRRSPATMPGYHAGRPPRNKGQLYPADPPTVEEIAVAMRHASDDRHTEARSPTSKQGTATRYPCPAVTAYASAASHSACHNTVSPAGPAGRRNRRLRVLPWTEGACGSVDVRG